MTTPRFCSGSLCVKFCDPGTFWLGYERLRSCHCQALAEERILRAKREAPPGDALPTSKRPRHAVREGSDDEDEGEDADQYAEEEASEEEYEEEEEGRGDARAEDYNHAGARGERGAAERGREWHAGGMGEDEGDDEEEEEEGVVATTKRRPVLVLSSDDDDE